MKQGIKTRKIDGAVQRDLPIPKKKHKQFRLLLKEHPYMELLLIG